MGEESPEKKDVPEEKEAPKTKDDGKDADDSTPTVDTIAKEKAPRKNKVELPSKVLYRLLTFITVVLLSFSTRLYNIEEPAHIW